MKKIKTRNVLITLLLGVVMVFGIVGCNSGNDLQSKIDGLQSRIEELEEQLRDRDATIEELNEQIREQDEKIEQLEEMLSRIDYRVVYENYSLGLTKDRKNFIGICNSNNDLMQMCTANNYGFYDQEDRDYESGFGKKLREYTEEFFKDKSLVVCVFIKPLYSGPLKVLSLNVIGNTLTLKIKEPFTGWAEDVEYCWGFIIEVDKESVSAVTNSTYRVIAIKDE